MNAYAAACRLLASGVRLAALYMMFTDLFPGLPAPKQLAAKALLLLALLTPFSVPVCFWRV